MFITCPHCRDLVALDPETRLPPPMCLRCGGGLPDMATARILPGGQTPEMAGPSIASLLRGGDRGAVAENAEQIPSADATAQPIAGEAAVQADVVQTDTETDVAAISDVVEMNAQPPVAMQEEMAAIDDPQAPEQPAPLLLLAPPVPSFTRQAARASTPPRTAKWQWAALIVLSLSLVMQVLLADRARLATDARWRPLITRMCNTLGCSVPAWHQPDAFAMLSRDVRPIADTPGGLHVQATFRNDARWPQPWPVLLLSLSDADGRVLGARAFTPGEYLGAAAPQTELAPGQSARISLQLREPDPNVVAFSFDFR
ncbi:MAG TPA: DUF3426 domain-containing protein [Pseudoxanthomonas sp.]